jgi:hypothetical protein
MTLKEIKECAVKDALTSALNEAAGELPVLARKLNSADTTEVDRMKHKWINEFRAHQATIDEAFCELYDPKPEQAK